MGEGWRLSPILGNIMRQSESVGLGLKINKTSQINALQFVDDVSIAQDTP